MEKERILRSEWDERQERKTKTKTVTKRYDTKDTPNDCHPCINERKRRSS
jgi:hypothetical protein